MPYKKIIIYGAGMVGNLVRQYLELQGLGKQIEAFTVTEQVEETRLYGYRFLTIDALKDFAKNCQVIIATFPGPQKSIENNLIRLGFDNILKIDFNMYHAMTKCYINNFIANKKLNDEYDVLYVSSDNNSSSGAFLCLVDLVVEAKKRKIRPLVVLPEYGNGEELLIEKEIEYIYIPSKTWLKRVDAKQLTWQEMEQYNNGEAIAKLEDIIEKCRIKLVHANTTYTNVAIVAANKKCVPVVWHLRERISEQGYGIDDEKHFYNMINSANTIITVSNYLKACYSNLNIEKTVTVYDGIDVDRYYVKRQILEDECIRIIVPGALYSLKRQEDVVKAAFELNKKNINFHIEFIGAGEEAYIEKIQNIITERALNNKIKFIGRVNNLDFYYKKSDIVISCSGVDSFGRVCVEGMLSGNLVIGANSGGTIEIIRNRETGLLFEYKNAESLAETIEYAISNVQAIRRIVANGQKYAKRHFDKKSCTKRIFDIYDDLMEGK